MLAGHVVVGLSVGLLAALAGGLMGGSVGAMLGWYVLGGYVGSGLSVLVSRLVRRFGAEWTQDSTDEELGLSLSQGTPAE